MLHYNSNITFVIYIFSVFIFLKHAENQKKNDIYIFLNMFFYYGSHYKPVEIL